MSICFTLGPFNASHFGLFVVALRQQNWRMLNTVTIAQGGHET